MVSAAELIQALQRRMQLVAPHLRRPPGEFPPGWQDWFTSMHQRAGAVTGAAAQALVDVILLRPVAAPPRRLGELTRWQAFSTLWRQEWHAPEREERHWRWFAGTVSVLWHIFFSAMLLWLMYLQYLAKVNPPPEGEAAVQVEFIGVGTPDEVGGGAQPQQTEPVEIAQAVEPSDATPASSLLAESPPSQSTPPASVAIETPQLDAQPPQVVQREVPEPQAPAPTRQAVTVSEPVPDSSAAFVLPSPTPRTAAPAVTVPELAAVTPALQVIEIPAPLPAAPPTAAPVRIVQPTLTQRVPDVAVREVQAPLRPAPVTTIPVPSMPEPVLQPSMPQVRSASIPTPDPPAPAASSKPAAAETSPSPATAATAATAAAKAAASSPSAAAPPSAQRPAAATAGAGPKKTPAPGGWATPKRADDWGDAARNQPGAQRGEDGLYNSDGSARLAAPPGSAAPGTPPGTVTQEIADLDRAGTWLKRAPVDYEPTAFDQYWRPNETLLAEWVRKSITTVRIPIPGTNKHIVCQTVLLALGGGCGITDPNLNEQPARARPPPDIPFKPELQEDNGSVRPNG